MANLAIKDGSKTNQQIGFRFDRSKHFFTLLGGYRLSFRQNLYACARFDSAVGPHELTLAFVA